MNWLRTTSRSGGNGGQGNPVTSLQSQMNRLFSSFLDDWPYGGLPGTGTESWGPPMDIEETADEFIVTAELPGVDPKDVEITAVGNELTIRGEVKSEEVEGRMPHRRERRVGMFMRSLTLPTNVDADKVRAECKNGVLTLVLPKREEAKPRAIKIETKG